LAQDNDLDMTAAPHRPRQAPARPGSLTVRLLALACVLTFTAGPAAARPAAELRPEPADHPDGIHVLDGSYVLDVGELHMNITNHGLIGSQFTELLPYSHAPSGEWPGGSGHEYLWGAGLWIGGRVNGQLAVTTGQPERELRPDDDIAATIYEAQAGRVVRPSSSPEIRGRRFPDLPADDDGDGAIDEDFLNGRDDDGDGLIDEDFGQIATQMFTCTMGDDLPLVRELYPDHLPLGVTVVQRAAAWYQADFEDMIAVEWEITNTGVDLVQDVFLGLYMDCDIQRRGQATQPDDLAGLYDGIVQDDNGLFHTLQVAWMRDAATVNPLKGWFGAVLLGHDTDFLQHYAPNRVDLKGFQIFATNARINQDGEPLNDADRYAVLSSGRRDPDRRLDQPGDLKVLMSWGPFGNLPPGRTVKSQVAFVVGNSQAEMLANAVKALEIYKGREFNADDVFITGSMGRETLICLGDYPTTSQGGEPLLSLGLRADLMDETCVPPDPVLGYWVLTREDFSDVDGRACAWVNTDNCEECFRAMGRECTPENELFWDFRASYPVSFWYGRHNKYYTGVNGGEFTARWIYPGEYPPRAPGLRLIPGDSQVELVWDDISEHDPDYVTGEYDFESYRIYRVGDWRIPPETSSDAGPPAVAWALVDEFDLINESDPRTGAQPNALPLGRNTGLEPIRYRPRCLDAPQFAGLAEVMQAFVDADTAGHHVVMPLLRDSQGRPVSGLQMFLPWESTPAVLDTFFAVTARDGDGPGRVAKRAVQYNHYIDRDAKNGFVSYYSVVPSDHLLQWDDDEGAYRIVGLGVQTDPGNNYQVTIPGPLPQTPQQRAAEGVNIYVYPNPATREALAEMQQQPPTGDDPTGVRVIFNNLPRARNVIRIYTASGDLVQTLQHDGLRDVGATSWNLMSRNGQEVVSGIYLYAVQSDDPSFADFHGRFVVIR
jgi:hypothetical protein